jgi:hypothetical protein
MARRNRYEKGVDGMHKDDPVIAMDETGAEVASDSFSLTAPQGAKELKPGDVPDFDELPALFAKKGAQ